MPCLNSSIPASCVDGVANQAKLRRVVSYHSVYTLAVVHSDLESESYSVSESGLVDKLHHIEAQVDYSLGKIRVLSQWEVFLEELETATGHVCFPNSLSKLNLTSIF